MKKIFLILLLLCIGGTAQAISFTDNFEGYGNYFLNLDDTNAPGAWTIQLDSKSVGNDLNSPPYGTRALKIDVNVLIDPVSRASIMRYQMVPTAINIHDFNASGKLYNWVRLDGNVAQVYSMSMRIGTNPTNYNAYYNVGQYGENYYSGWQLMTYDLNTIGTQVASPDDTNYNTLETSTNYALDGNQFSSDHNFWINDFWLEKSTGATNGVWRELFNGTAPYGWSKPYLDSGDYSLVIAPTDRVANQNQAFVFIPSLAAPDLNADVNMNALLKQLDNNMGTKFIFDYVDASNYSSVYLHNTNGTSAKIGVETYTAGVRDVNETTVTYVKSVYHSFAFNVIGKLVQVDFNGTRVHTGTLTARQVGGTGIDSNAGQSMVDDYNITFTPQAAPVNPNAPIDYRTGLILIIRGIIFPAVIAFVILNVLFKTQGDIKSKLMAIVVIYVMYRLFDAMFFGV